MMSMNYDIVIEHLRKANFVFATLGFPNLTDQAVDDIADLAGVPVKRVQAFAKYGRLNGREAVTDEDREKLRTAHCEREDYARMRAELEREHADDAAELKAA